MATYRATLVLRNNSYYTTIDYYWDNDGNNNISWQAHVNGAGGDDTDTWICCRTLYITGGKNSNGDLTGDITQYVGDKYSCWGDDCRCTKFDNGWGTKNQWLSGTIAMGSGGGTLYLGFRGNANGQDRSGYNTWTIGELNWTATVNYNANGGSGAPSAQTHSGISPNTNSYNFTVSATVPTKGTSRFDGWKYNGIVYHAGDTITVYKSSRTITLTAVWTDTTTYTLTYNANGGTNTPAPETATTLDTSYTFTVTGVQPERASFKFLGWAESASATVPTIMAGDSITLTSSNRTKTIYAVWAPYYRPGEVLTGGSWKSTNRSAGKCHIKRNDQWVEMRTASGGTGTTLSVIVPPVLSNVIVTSFNAGNLEAYAPTDLGAALISPISEIRHIYTQATNNITIEVELENGDVITRYNDVLNTTAVSISTRLGCTGLGDIIATPPATDLTDTLTLTTELGDASVDPPNIRTSGLWVNQISLGSY